MPLGMLGNLPPKHLAEMNCVFKDWGFIKVW